jgi:hypothetical protein
MGLRFRRRISLAPGFSLNLGKRGASLSVGRRGAHVTVGHGQVRSTVGLPGSGISYTKTTSVQGDRQDKTTITLWQALKGGVGLIIIMSLLGFHGEWVAWFVVVVVAAALGSNFRR